MTMRMPKTTLRRSPYAIRCPGCEKLVPATYSEETKGFWCEECGWPERREIQR